MIENRNLAAGTRLVAKYKGQTYGAVVLEGGGLIVDGNDRIFKSPSSAGSSVMNGIACNGYRFWSVEGETQAPSATVAPVKAKGTLKKSKAGGTRPRSKKAAPEATQPADDDDPELNAAPVRAEVAAE